MMVIIVIDLIIQIGFGLFYIANRRLIIDAARKEFYDIGTQYKMLNLTAGITVVAIWGTYCMLIHSIAPVLMSTALRGWAVFVFLISPTMIIPFLIYKWLIKVYVSWIMAVVDDQRVLEANSIIADLQMKKKDMTTELARLKGEIAKIQDDYQQRSMRLNTIYYQLSDIIRWGLMEKGSTVKMSEYQIRTIFRVNNDNIIKSPNNDNAIFVRTDSLNRYEFLSPEETRNLHVYYYETEESRFLMV